MRCLRIHSRREDWDVLYSCAETAGPSSLLLLWSKADTTLVIFVVSPLLNLFELIRE